MTTYIALLRAVNVGGTGKLPMADLKALCEQAGFTDVRTYIASGNVVFSSASSPSQARARLEARLKAAMAKPAPVIIRSAAEMAAVLANNPFTNAATNRTVAVFLDAAPPATALDDITGQNGEQIALGKREIYIHYGERMADSKLKIAAAKTGTARNMNTIAKLAAMAAE